MASLYHDTELLTLEFTLLEKTIGTITEFVMVLMDTVMVPVGLC